MGFRDGDSPDTSSIDRVLGSGSAASACSRNFCRTPSLSSAANRGKHGDADGPGRAGRALDAARGRAAVGGREARSDPAGVRAGAEVMPARAGSRAAGPSWTTTRSRSSPARSACWRPTSGSMSGPGARPSTTGLRSAATWDSGSAAPKMRTRSALAAARPCRRPVPEWTALKRRVSLRSFLNQVHVADRLDGSSARRR